MLHVLSLFCRLSLKYRVTAANTSTAGSSLSVMSINVVVSDRSYMIKCIVRISYKLSISEVNNLRMNDILFKEVVILSIIIVLNYTYWVFKQLHFELPEKIMFLLFIRFRVQIIPLCLISKADIVFSVGF